MYVKVCEQFKTKKVHSTSFNPQLGFKKKATGKEVVESFGSKLKFLDMLFWVVGKRFQKYCYRVDESQECR